MEYPPYWPSRQRRVQYAAGGAALILYGLAAMAYGRPVAGGLFAIVFGYGILCQYVPRRSVRGVRNERGGLRLGVSRPRAWLDPAIVLGLFLGMAWTVGGAWRIAMLAGLAVVVAMLLVRRLPFAPSLRLDAEGVTFNRRNVPWDRLLRIRPAGSLTLALDTGEAKELSLPAWALGPDASVVYWTLRHYLDNPRDRAELADERAVARVVRTRDALSPGRPARTESRPTGS